MRKAVSCRTDGQKALEALRLCFGGVSVGGAICCRRGNEAVGTVGSGSGNKLMDWASVFGAEEAVR